MVKLYAGSGKDIVRAPEAPSSGVHDIVRDTGNADEAAVGRLLEVWCVVTVDIAEAGASGGLPAISFILASMSRLVKATVGSPRPELVFDSFTEAAARMLLMAERARPYGVYFVHHIVGDQGGHDAPDSHRLYRSFFRA